MKRLLTFLFVLTLVESSEAQTLRYNILEYVLSHDFKNSSAYLIKNGFNIKKLYTPVGNIPDHYYIFVKNEGINSITISKRTYGVSASFYSNSEFIFFKKYVKDKLAFALDSTKNTISANMEFYHNSNLGIIFYKGWDHGFKSKALIRSYNIELVDINLYKKRGTDEIEW